jgi:hypothetical protein
MMKALRSFETSAATYSASQRNIPEKESLKMVYSGIRDLEICLRDLRFSWSCFKRLPGVHKSLAQKSLAQKSLGD